MTQDRSQTAKWGLVNQEQRAAQLAIAGKLVQSGMLAQGPAENCAQACITAIAMAGLKIERGTMKMEAGPINGS